ncbi:DUF2860 domain-containing protein [Endozoicomonas sp.]|nr:DUF2860 domain-containing protein [Endozoicomonas sp.]
MKTHYLLLAALTVSCPTLANMHNDPFEQQGISGELSLLSGYGKSTSNLDTDHNATIGSLNHSDSSKSSGFLAPLGELRYTFDNQQVFAGISRSDIVEGTVALALGYAVQLSDKSEIALSYLPSIVGGEVWEDPYLVNAERQKTDVKGHAYRVQFNNIRNTHIDAEFAYYDREIDTERSGSTLHHNADDLKREGNGYLVGISTGFPFTESVIVVPNLKYHKFSADGKAMAFDEYSLNVTGIYRHNQHAISLNTSYAQEMYDETNPLFNKTRKDSEIGINLMYEYSHFMRYNNLSFNLLASYSDSDSNITFYDEKGHMFGIGLSYTI